MKRFEVADTQPVECRRDVINVVLDTHDLSKYDGVFMSFVWQYCKMSITLCICISTTPTELCYTG